MNLIRLSEWSAGPIPERVHGAGRVAATSPALLLLADAMRMRCELAPLIDPTAGPAGDPPKRVAVAAGDSSSIGSEFLSVATSFVREVTGTASVILRWALSLAWDRQRVVIAGGPAGRTRVGRKRIRIAEDEELS